MKLCSDGHEEVAYECRDCPVCVLLDELKDCEKALSLAQDRVATLEDEVAEAQEKETA